MSENITWRNHYIPQFILRSFLNKDIKKVYCLDVFKKDAEWLENTTKNCGYKKHLYTFKNSDSLEKSISTIESDFSRIVKQIKSEYLKNIVLSNKHVSFYFDINDKDSIEICSLYLALQYIRNPLFFQKNSDFRQCYYEENYNSQNGTFSKSIYRNEDLIPSIFNLLPNILNIIKDDYFLCVYFSYSKNIILPDSGIGEIFNLKNLNNILVLPVSSKILVIAIRKEKRYCFLENFMNKDKKEQADHFEWFQNILNNNIHSTIFCKEKVSDTILTEIRKKKYLNAFFLREKFYIPNTEYN